LIVSLEELIKALNPIANPRDTLPSDALWITFAPEGERHAQSADYRTPDDNTLVRVYLDRNGAVVGLEIFP